MKGAFTLSSLAWSEPEFVLFAVFVKLFANSCTNTGLDMVNILTIPSNSS